MTSHLGDRAGSFELSDLLGSKALPGRLSRSLLPLPEPQERSR